MRRRARGLTLAVAVASMAVTATSCAATSTSTNGVAPVPVVADPGAFVGHGSVGQAYITGTTPGRELVLVNAAGHQVASGTTDAYGSLVVRNLVPGPGYRFRTSVRGREIQTPPFPVLSLSDIPPQSFYADQHMHVGLNYITMRDGVKLAATLRLPYGESLKDGPFPTVIEDSGYAIAAPGDLLAHELDPQAGGNPALLPDSATAVGSVVAPLLGFATVSLQMRGTGCSGGAFGLFDLPTTADGYDAVEIVAAQPFVKGHRVGLVGISYSGISQLFVAGTRPPGLAAIAPMSVTDDLYSTGYPGGIFNDGFADSWIQQRVQDAEPAPQGGQPYARALIAAGDKQCLANQRLRLQTQNVDALLADNTHRTPSLFEVRSPSAWAAKIDVPVFLTGQFQDEQTGGQWPAVIAALRHDPDVFVTMQNGVHTDSLSPETLSRWIEFLHLFVADDLPSEPGITDYLAATLFKVTTGASAAPLPPLRFTTAPSVAVARQEFEGETPRIRVLFDNGGGSVPGALGTQWEADYSTWPPPTAVATTYDLGLGGMLTTVAGAPSTVAFRPDPSTRPATDLPAGASVGVALPPYDWTPLTPGAGLGFISAPLADDVVAIGPASLDVWLESSASDTDLQATVSDVLANGSEMFVQSGVLRASDRALDARLSTALSPVPTYLAADATPLPSGTWSLVRIPILPFAHAFRVGDRIRVTITAPGGDRPAWAFATYQTDGAVVDAVSLGGTHSSTLVLPIVPGLRPTDPPPRCPSLRGEPCRTYVPASNGG